MFGEATDTQNKRKHTLLYLTFIFSTIPIMVRFIFLQKSISFLIVAKATSWGVVTMMAPSGHEFINPFTTVMCSSDVPGGEWSREKNKKQPYSLEHMLEKYDAAIILSQPFSGTNDYFPPGLGYNANLNTTIP